MEDRIKNKINLYFRHLQMNKEKLEYDLTTIINNDSIELNDYFKKMTKVLSKIEKNDKAITSLVFYLNLDDNENNVLKEKKDDSE